MHGSWPSGNTYIISFYPKEKVLRLPNQFLSLKNGSELAPGFSACP
jgi:hypothetical protein